MTPSTAYRNAGIIAAASDKFIPFNPNGPSGLPEIGPLPKAYRGDAQLQRYCELVCLLVGKLAEERITGKPDDNPEGPLLRRIATLERLLGEDKAESLRAAEETLHCQWPFIESLAKELAQGRLTRKQIELNHHVYAEWTKMLGQCGQLEGALDKAWVGGDDKSPGFAV